MIAARLLGRAVLAAGIVCGLAHPLVAATKTDVIELRNGDRITCEIKKLERGKVVVKTDGIGTISIEWDDIERIASTAVYDVEQIDGRRVFGSLVRAEAGTVDIVSALQTERLGLATIVRISPLGGTFWRRLDGTMDAGFNFTQANVQTQWTSNVSVSFRSRHWLSELTGDSALTIREDANRQTRNTVGLQTQRFLQPRWWALGFVQFQQNEELDLNLRAIGGGGFGRVLARSNSHSASVVAGVAFTQEEYEDAEPDRVAEALAGLTWGWFTFDGRSTNLDVSAFSFTALSRDARVRLELNTKFKSDIVGDLYWSINAFESYNSDPPTGRKSNDFGVSAAVGWSF